VYSINPNRLDRKFLFEGAATELGNLPLEASAGPQSITAELLNSTAQFFEATVTGGAQAPAARPKIVARRKQLRDKPHAGTLVDPSHPLAHGLACAYFLNERGGERAFDALGATAPLTATGVTWNNSGDTTFSTASVSRFSGVDSIRHRLPTSQVTIAVAVTITSNGQDLALYYGKAHDFSNETWGIRNQVWNTFNDTQSRMVIDGTQRTTPNGACPLSFNIPYILIARWSSGSTIDLFVFDRRTNALVSSTQSASSFTGSLTYDTRDVMIGRRIFSDNTDPRYINGRVDFALTSSRSWTDSEIRRFVAAPFEMLAARPAPLIIVADGGGGSPQTVDGVRLESTATLYQGAVVPGAVTVSANRLESTATLYQASIVPGAVTVSANRLESTAVLYQATVLPGPVTISANRLESTATLYQAAVVPGAATITANALGSTAVLYNATITPGAVTVSADRLESTATLYQAVITSGLQIIANLLDSTAALYEASIIGSDITQDTSDILDRYRKYSKRERDAEEAIAAQILRKRLDKERKKLERQKFKKQVQEQLESGATVEQAVATLTQEIKYEFTEEIKREVDKDVSTFLNQQLDGYIAELRAKLEETVDRYYSQARIEKQQAEIMLAQKEREVSKIKRRKRNVKRAKILFMLLQAEDEI
jgi:hypothetical protein